jgi:hypothetical protein
MIEPKTSGSNRRQTLARLALAAVAVVLIAGGAYWYFGTDSDETTIPVGPPPQQTKGGKPVYRRFDGILVTDNAVVLDAPEATLQIPVNRKGQPGLPAARFRITPNPAPEVQRAERAHQRLLNDPDAAAALKLSDEQLAAIKALAMPSLRLSDAERGQLKAVYDAYNTAGSAARWGMEPVLLEVLHDVAAAKLPETRKDAATMAQRFDAILTEDQRKQLPDVLATPVKPATTRSAPAATKAATKPATTKPTATRPVATKPAATKPAATKPAATKPAATKPTAKPATAKASTRAGGAGTRPATQPK